MVHIDSDICTGKEGKFMIDYSMEHKYFLYLQNQ